MKIKYPKKSLPQTKEVASNDRHVVWLRGVSHSIRFSQQDTLLGKSSKRRLFKGLLVKDDAIIYLILEIAYIAQGDVVIRVL